MSRKTQREHLKTSTIVDDTFFISARSPLFCEWNGKISCYDQIHCILDFHVLELCAVICARYDHLHCFGLRQHHIVTQMDEWADVGAK